MGEQDPQFAMTKSLAEVFRAMTGPRGEVIRAIAANALFSKDPVVSIGYARVCVAAHVRQALGPDVTLEEIFNACVADAA